MKAEQLTLFDMPAESKPKSVCLSVGDFAKVLASKGIVTGEKRLFDKLRKWGMLDKRNVPYQEFVRRGYFKVVNERFAKGGNFPSIYLKVLITPNGQKYISERYQDERNGNWS